jgi:hypothetical protein
MMTIIRTPRVQLASINALIIDVKESIDNQIMIDLLRDFTPYFLFVDSTMMTPNTPFMIND